MRILILNWKDNKHPDSGGAEKVTQEYAKHLVQLGHQVWIFCSHAKNLVKDEIVAGVQVIRRGSIYTVHLHAWYFYCIAKRFPVDIVIDQIHGFPFFTLLYIRKPILAWIHEVANEIWLKEFPLPVAIPGRLLELTYLKLYRNIPFVTHTQSTRRELESLSIPNNNIHLLPHTIDQIQIPKIAKSKHPSLFYIGRISPMKRIELLLYTAQLLRPAFPKLHVNIAGKAKPNYLKKLQHMIDGNKLQSAVRFLGSVPETVKYRLLASSWLHIHPSLKEGFGLTVLEAATAGTPTVCFNVSGLKDTVISGVNGEVVKETSVIALVQAISNLFYDKQKLARLSKSAKLWSKSLPAWSTQTKKLEKLLTRIVAN